MTKGLIGGLTGIGLALVLAAPAEADVTPRLWGTSYAIVMGYGDPVLGAQNRPVRVSARMPHQLQCSHVLHVTRQPADRQAVLDNAFLAAQVQVTIERGHCRGDWRDRWTQFVVPGPTGSDILDLTFVSPDGRLLSRERVAVETTSTGGDGPDD